MRNEAPDDVLADNRILERIMTLVLVINDKNVPAPRAKTHSPARCAKVLLLLKVIGSIHCIPGGYSTVDQRY